jgi:hypothetical protein
MRRWRGEWQWRPLGLNYEPGECGDGDARRGGQRFSDRDPDDRDADDRDGADGNACCADNRRRDRYHDTVHEYPRR